MAVSKKKVIKSLENLTEDLRDLIKDQYPGGYESVISRITNAKKEPIFVFPLETEDATYLIKVPVTKNSDGEYDLDAKQEPDLDNTPADDPLGSDDSFAGGSDSGEDDLDEDGSTKSREASYDPDFDN